MSERTDAIAEVVAWLRESAAVLRAKTALVPAVPDQIELVADGIEEHFAVARITSEGPS